MTEAKRAEFMNAINKGKIVGNEWANLIIAKKCVKINKIIYYLDKY